MSKTIETPSQTNSESIFKITELQEKFQIKVSDEELEKYKDAIFSMKEIQKIKDWKDTVSEIASVNLENLKKKFENWKSSVESSLKRSSEIRAAGEEEAKESLEKVSDEMEWLDENKTVTKAKEKVTELKDKAIDLKDDLSVDWIMLSLEKIEKEGWFLWFLVGILLWIMRIFWYKNKLEDTKEKVESTIKNLSPEKIKEVKDKTKETIIAWLWGNLTPENKAKLDKAIDWLSEEQLKILYEKLQKWELTFGEISKIIPDFFKEVISPEQIEKTKKEIQKELIEALRKEIKEKYNIDLDEGKLAKLRELVEKNTTISEQTIALFYEIGNKKEFKVKDFFGPWLEAWINTSSLMIWLLINGIIPISAFSMDFAKSWVEIIQFSIDSMWIWSSINIDTFNKTIETFTPEQKAILIWLLYRKGWLFLSMIWSIWESISRLGIEFLTNTQVKWYQTLWAWLSWNYARQAELFWKLSKNISPELYKDSDDILKKANAAFKKLEDNYKIIDLLQKSSLKANDKEKIETATKLLKDAKIQIPSWIDTSDFNKFVEWFKPSMEHTFEWLSKWAITSKLWFWASADLYELESKIQKITQAQRRLLNWNFLLKWVAKLRELANIWEVSRMWDRMVLHFSSKEEAIKWISKWNILANKFPELIKWTLDKLPIIAVAWIAANSEGPFFEEMQKQLLYLIPVVWPVLLISDSWLNWENWKPKIINWIDAWIWWALLAIDWVFLLKEISKSWLKWWLWYIAKPFRDIYGIWRWAAEWVYSVWKAINWWKSLSWAIKESINKSKAIKNPKVRAIAVIWLIWYAWYSYAFEDDSLKEVFDKEWKLDKEKLKTELPNLNDEDKTTVLKYILSWNLWENFFKNINLDIKNNVLYIKSNDEKVQESWFIDQETLEILWLNPKIEFSFEKKPA